MALIAASYFLTGRASGVGGMDKNGSQGRAIKPTPYPRRPNTEKICSFIVGFGVPNALNGILSVEGKLAPPSATGAYKVLLSGPAAVGRKDGPIQ